MVIEKKGMMFILSSPSGAGKTTLTKKLAANNSNFKISISYTTRKPRPNEVNGKDYNFVSNDEFNLLIKKKSFFEYANIFDNCYGTPKQPVLDLLSKGKDVLFDIDWKGTQQLKKIDNLSLVTFFILPPNIKTLKERLLKRHEGQEKLIAEKKKVAYHIFNVGNNRNNCTKKNLVDKIVRSLKYKNNRINYLNKGFDRRNYKVDFSKIEKVLKIKTKFDINYGIKEIVSFFKKNKNYFKNKKLGNYKI